MFRFDEELKVYLHREAVDFRLSINSGDPIIGEGDGLLPVPAEEALLSQGDLLLTAFDLSP